MKTTPKQRNARHVAALRQELEFMTAEQLRAACEYGKRRPSLRALVARQVANAAPARPAAGPWTANFDGTITGAPYRWPPRDPGRVDANIVATVHAGDCGQYRNYPREIAEANKRLIAAAPEMETLARNVAGGVFGPAVMAQAFDIIARTSPYEQERKSAQARARDLRRYIAGASA